MKHYENNKLASNTSTAGFDSSTNNLNYKFLSHNEVA